MKKGTPEIRFGRITGLQFRDAPAGSASPGGFRGYAAVYNSPSVVMREGGKTFREFIAPGAFDTAIEADDVRALINHDPNLILARTTAGTMSLASDETGLLVDIPELPDTSYARDLLESLKRGDVDQMSFGFVVVNDDWTKDSDGGNVRTLREVRLFDVSPVTFPAYPDTVAEARSVAAALAALAGVREGKTLSQKNQDAISAAVEHLNAVLADAEPADENLFEFNSEAERQTRGLRAVFGEKRDGMTIVVLGWMLADAEDFVSYYADDDEDKAAMQEIIASLKAMIAVEAAPDADDEDADGVRSKGNTFGLLRARLSALALGAPVPTHTLT